ncbi:MAG: hypothetical protein HBSAPP03_06310 [Phycisphaerae bacterium]|nr:MAG: hypothetical protein HBSAPP03_06310 [Phycisphaerae bacterium]
MHSLALVAVLALSQPAPDLRTVAERSDWKKTARHAEVVALLDALAASDPRATRVSLGTTTEGRDLPVLVLADPPVANAAEARRLATDEGRVIVLVIGNIHAGEVCGKEALPILARELLADPASPVLRRAVIAFAPIYNADGNERMDPGNRPGQNGPDEMGVRHNAMDLDLNRDFVKLEAPETAGLVRFLNEWDPHLFIDTHTTNGSFHRFTISYAGAKCLTGDLGVREFTRDAFLPGLAARYEAISGEKTFYYGSFGGGVFSENPADKSTWGTFPAEARFGTTYVGLRGRLSLLSEAYTYAPYKDRVLRTRDMVAAALDWAVANAESVRRVTARADAEAVARQPAEVVIRSKLVACPGTHTILGFEEVIVDGKRVNTGRPKDYPVTLMDCFEPEITVTRPRAYVLPRDPRLEPVIAKLRQHGIIVGDEVTGGPMAVEAYTLTRATPASRAFQGHVLVRAAVRADPATIDVPAGSWMVRTDQPLGNLAVYLLEPECEDGLTTWNFFDAWMKEGERFPAYRVMP